ncbi:phage tail tape measure protein [Sphingomonas populi]|uniref:Phage tail tape measure protein n=1 Tax=Sphingomonas populi TaxID=2484750 RepID=A0A4Q6Y918_9SPHN|nr:phage tail tape measure protein [Sphingomonas populi]RZF65866.1 phage tail tape measure protein [Sphingomonas populi]
MLGMLASLTVSLAVKDAAFKSGMGAARDEARRTGQDFDKAGRTMSDAMNRAAEQANLALVSIAATATETAHKIQMAGLAMSAAMLAPLTVIGKKSNDAASDFEKAMNDVHAAMLDASPDQLNKLRVAAMALGPAFGRSAMEAAGGIAALARNGMSAADILDGGLVASLKLAALGQTDLSSAVDVTSDILQQFHLPVSQLPTLVNKVSGSLDASKLSFDDFRDAIAQVGGVAGGLGYSFDDMNTALATLIPLMGGGSDAGTSFKTFLLSLNPSSDQAKRDLDTLGISFFNVAQNGDKSAKSLSEIADILNQKVANLNDMKKRQFLTDVFGTDGMRAAIALMDAGAKKVGEMRSQIDKASADQKLSALMQGEANATMRVANAWEKLKIVIGDSGLIQAMTWIKNTFADAINWLASFPPWVYITAAAVQTLGAAFFALVPFMAKVVATGILMRFGPIATALAALVNPIGVAIRLFGALALQMGATRLAAMAMNAAIMSNWALALAAGVYLVYQQYSKVPEASDAAKASLDAATAANKEATDSTYQLITATGKLRVELLAKAKLDRAAAADALKKADADLEAAHAAYTRAKAESRDPGNYPAIGGSAMSVGSAVYGTGKKLAQARADLEANIKTVGQRIEKLNTIRHNIGIAEAPVGPKLDPNFDRPERTRNGPKGRDTSADAYDYAAKLADARQDVLDANADMTDNPRARYKADMGAIEKERAEYAHQLATDQAITSAQADKLIAIKEQAFEYRKGIANQRLSDAVNQQEYDLAIAVNDAEQTHLSAMLDLAQSTEERRKLSDQILAKQKEAELKKLDLTLATAPTSSAEWTNAARAKDRLDAVYADKQAKQDRENESPAASYMRSLNQTSGQIADTVQSGAVDALKDLNTGLSDAILGAKSLGDAFADMGKRIIASLLDIAIQQALIKPLANTLFGGMGGGGGLIGSISGFLGQTFGGGRATGGSIQADRWYTVGERGPERFYPGISGTVVPNGGRGAGPSSTPSVVQLVVGPGQLFEPTVQAISGNVSVQTVSGYAGKVATRQARTLRG